MQNQVGRIDLHMHSTVSDGTDTPQMLLEKVRAAGIAVFSVTDHDAVKAGQIIRFLLKPGDPRFIPGVEFSCRDEKGKYHILGYGFDPDAAPLHALVLRGHSLRMQKVCTRLDHLRDEFGFVFPQEEIDRLLALDNPGKPHIGNLMVQLGYAKSMREAIISYIDRLNIQSESVRPQEAIEGILAGGGIPVLAHPLFGSGSERFGSDEMERRLRRLIGCGLQGAEVFYSGFSPEQQAEMLALAEKYDLFVTAGSDYHGLNKKIVLGDTGLSETTVYPDGLRRFLECFNL